MGGMESDVRRLHVTVHGRVQGVGFRWYVRVRARALGLSGWVRNRPDGSVEVLAAGDGAALQALKTALNIGPDGASVESIRSVTDAPAAEAMTPFSVLR